MQRLLHGPGAQGHALVTANATLRRIRFREPPPCSWRSSLLPSPKLFTSHSATASQNRKAKRQASVLRDHPAHAGPAAGAPQQLSDAKDLAPAEAQGRKAAVCWPARPHLTAGSGASLGPSAPLPQDPWVHAFWVTGSARQQQRSEKDTGTRSARVPAIGTSSAWNHASCKL